MRWIIALVSFRFQITFRFDRRHATRPGRRNRLPIRPVLHVACMEDALAARTRAAMRNDVAIRIQVDLPDEGGRIRNVPDRNEEAVDRLHLAAVRLTPAQ